MARVRDSISVVEAVYHQKLRQQPTSLESTFSRDLVSDGDPYQVTMVVTEEWQDVDVGWVERCGMMVLKNLEGLGLQVIPTEAEVAAIESRVVDIAFGDDRAAAHVPPRATSHLWPDVTVRVRCRSGTARLLVFASPE